MPKKLEEQEFGEEVEKEVSENPVEQEECVNAIEAIWNFFSSMKLGIILLIIIAIASVWGTIFVATDENGQPNYMAFYGAFWFRGLLFLLMMNLLICSINRWGFIKKSLGEPKSRVSDNFLKKLKSFETLKFNGSVEKVSKDVEEAIRYKGYRVFTEKDGDKTYVSADKGRHGVLGSFITHIAFIIIPLAALYGSYTGFEGFAMAPEGESFKVSQVVDPIKNVKNDFEVRVDKFWIDYRPDGTVKQYYSKLTVIENGQEQLTKEINVNDPLQWKGVKFYQSSYQFFDSTKLTAETLSPTGEKADFVVEASNYAQVPGSNLYIQVYQFIPDFDPSNPQQSRSNQPNNPAVIYALYKGDQRVDMNYAMLNKPLTFEGTSITFKEFDMKQGAATGLSVRKDPGVWYVWLGCASLLIGMFISYYLQHRKIWAVVSTNGSYTFVDIGGTTDKNKLAFESDFEDIVDYLSDEEE